MLLIGKREKIFYACAPFEAEWQCVHRERNNIVDSIISVDGDCIILGARKIYFKDKFENDTFSACIKEEDTNEKDANPLFAYDTDKWYLIGGMLGCDYINNHFYRM